nr:MAG TPA: tail assembly chaperone protein [Caudoviricetes sp.]
MDSLKINGTDYKIKFDHRFYERVLSNFAKKHKDANVDGFNHLIAGLIDEDPDSVVEAYRCAISGKNLPTANDVSNALDEEGVFDDKNLYSDVFNQIKSSGFLAKKVAHLLKLLHKDWKDSEIALQVFTNTGNKSDKDYKKNLQEARVEVAVRKRQWELAKDQLAQLSK